MLRVQLLPRRVRVRPRSRRNRARPWEDLRAGGKGEDLEAAVAAQPAFAHNHVRRRLPGARPFAAVVQFPIRHDRGSALRRRSGPARRRSAAAPMPAVMLDQSLTGARRIDAGAFRSRNSLTLIVNTGCLQ